MKMFYLLQLTQLAHVALQGTNFWGKALELKGMSVYSIRIIQIGINS